MKHYLILKDCTGSQTGLDFHAFKAGSTAALSADLARAFVAQGWAKPVGQAKAEIAKAPPALADAVLETVEEASLNDTPIEDRETKVIEPEETKPDGPAKKKGKK